MDRLIFNIDDKLNDEATQILDDLGMDMTSAITLFLSQIVKEQGFPFNPSEEALENK